MSNQPGRLWRFRQRTAALVKTLSAPADKRKAQATLKRTGVSAAGFTAAYFIATTPAMAAVPFLMTFGPFVAGGAGVVFGVMAWRGVSDLNKSMTVNRHMGDAKQKWIDKKNRPPLFKRMGTSLGNGLSAVGRTLTAPLRWRPFAKKADNRALPGRPADTDARTLDGSASITADLNKAAEPALSPERLAAAEKRAARRQQTPGNRF